jgi:hypothetical protein
VTTDHEPKLVPSKIPDQSLPTGKRTVHRPHCVSCGWSCRWRSPSEKLAMRDYEDHVAGRGVG